jgi:hypothetical protein
MTDKPAGKHLYAVNEPAIARDALVLLDLGDIQFLLQGGLASLLPISAMQPTTGELACGFVEFEGKSLSVFSLNRNLQLQVPASTGAHALAIMVADDQAFALACCNLEKLAGPAPVLYPVPVSMTSRKQPFQEFAVIDNRAVGLSCALELWRLLCLRGASFLAGNKGQALFQQGA